MSLLNGFTKVREVNGRIFKGSFFENYLYVFSDSCMIFSELQYQEFEND